jgi:peptide deformylase
LAIRKIRVIEDSVLRKKSKEIKKVDDKIREIINDLVETMYNDENGGGLAAPQVGLLKRIIVLDLREEIGLVKLVNPVIVESYGELEVIEGCLSIPNTYGKLKRPEKVIVRGLNEFGEEIEICGEGNMAKGFCHEIDHLNGILFTDHVYEHIK